MNIEPLEARLAPASLTYLDVDGDSVTIKTTGPGVLAVGTSVILSSGSMAATGQLQALVLTEGKGSGEKSGNHELTVLKQRHR